MSVFALSVAPVLTSIVLHPTPPRPLVWSDWASALLTFVWIGICPVVFQARWMLRDQIVADENGLGWREGSQWKSVSWPEVEDFLS